MANGAWFSFPFFRAVKCVFQSTNKQYETVIVKCITRKQCRVNLSVETNPNTLVHYSSIIAKVGHSDIQLSLPLPQL
ncbi:hypothetical protein C0J52_23269 [Blattella germanica]|nr:hypothetical protein C0J52_23269 [Blattella germanica]